MIGAFIAGMVLAEVNERYRLGERTASVGELVVPFFFVVTGASTDLGALLQPQSALLVVAVVGGVALARRSRESDGVEEGTA